MRRKDLVWEWVQLGLIVGMFALAAIRWPALPDRLPIHWNASGQVDGYGGKFMGLLLIPLIAAALYLLLRFIPRIDPARANYASFQGTWMLLRVTLLAYLGFVYVLMHLAYAKGEEFHFDRLLYGGIGVLFVILGGVMGKLRPNWFAGIRTPWTLSSKRSWVKTHRVGGWVFIAAGVVTGIGAFVGGAAAIIGMLVVLLPGIVFLFAYSYFVWRDDPERVPAQQTEPADDA